MVENAAVSQSALNGDIVLAVECRCQDRIPSPVTTIKPSPNRPPPSTTPSPATIKPTNAPNPPISTSSPSLVPTPSPTILNLPDQTLSSAASFLTTPSLIYLGIILSLYKKCLRFTALGIKRQSLMK